MPMLGICAILKAWHFLENRGLQTYTMGGPLVVRINALWNLGYLTYL